MKTLRNIVLAAAGALALGSAALAQDAQKLEAKPEAKSEAKSESHGGCHGAAHGARHGKHERHGKQEQEKHDHS